MKHKLSAIVFLSQLSFFALSAQENKATLSSPDNLLQVRVFEENGSPFMQ
ncbi:MAG: hypothetical protein LBB79_01325 [Prevotellaceae bacterium]|jgi:hypothetical protein|nr:hypothetical protein [Prevotellaceae bacterium]